MILRNSDIKMGNLRNFSRVDTFELKAQIFKKLGKQRADKYFFHLTSFFSFKVSKSEFDKACVRTIGKENVMLHNRLIGAIVKNACGAKTGPPKVDVNGYQKSSSQSLNGDVFPPSARKVRTSCVRDRKFRDRRSPLGPQAKTNSTVCDAPTPKTQEQQSELFSLGSRPPVEVISVEDGEEVEQMMGSPGIQSRTPLRAPLGVSTNMGGAHKTLRSSSFTSFHLDNCCNSYVLPDTRSLRKRLVQNLEKEGLSISMDCVDLLNNGLDAYLKRLIKPCIQLAGASCGGKHQKQVNDHVVHSLEGMGSERNVQTQSASASVLDFFVAMLTNPQLLGEDCPVQLERILLRLSEE